MPKTKRPACKKDSKGVQKIRNVDGRCVTKCAPLYRRVNGRGVCKPYARSGLILNKTTGKFVKPTGRVGQWVKGKTKINPSTGIHQSYEVALRQVREKKKKAMAKKAMK